MAASPMNDSACELLKVSATKLALKLSFFFGSLTCSIFIFRGNFD